MTFYFNFCLERKEVSILMFNKLNLFDKSNCPDNFLSATFSVRHGLMSENYMHNDVIKISVELWT